MILRQKQSADSAAMKEGMFYLTMHSTHFIYGYMASGTLYSTASAGLFSIPFFEVMNSAS